MKAKGKRDQYEPSMSDDAVQARTGKSWSEWFALLDKAGAKKQDHKGIVAILMGRFNVGSWWRQMVTVEYERARGLRQKHETPSGYSISRSKTLAAPAEAVFAAWTKTQARRRWLNQEGLVIRKATPNRSIRMTWVDALTSVEVMLYSKGRDKTQVTVQHNKLPNAKAGEHMKTYWSGKLERLQENVERPRGQA